MKIGIGIISWCRTHCFSRLIKSLEKNDLSNTEFHLFQDGAVCMFNGERLAKETDILRSIGVFKKAEFPKKYFHIRDENVSIAINQFEAMRFLYSNYDKFIFLENDIIVSPNLITLMKVALNQFQFDNKIACISSGFRLLCKQPEVRRNLDKLIRAEGHFWAEACWAKKWRKIEKAYMPYYNIVKRAPYRERNHGAINKLFNDTGHPRPVTSQDSGKDWAMKMLGMERIRFVVNRATGIGGYGVHSTPEKLKKFDGYNKIYVSEEDLKINRFKLVNHV